MKEFLEKTIREAGELAKGYFVQGMGVEYKTDETGTQQYSDIVTTADMAVNRFLVDTISREYPTHKITSEELDTVMGDSEYEWIIDPIDGTWYFAHSVPVWGIIISIVQSGTPICSAVYFPVSDQLFFADEQHSYLNGKIVKISGPQKNLDTAKPKIFTMRPHGPYGVEFERFQKAVNKYILTREFAPKNFGAASSLVYLITGAFDFAISNGGMVWDFVGPIHILRNAGAVVTDSRGNEWTADQQGYVAASDATLHAEVLSLFE